MPVDPPIVDSVVGPYRQVLVDLQGATTTGLELAEMTWAVAEMERLASMLEDPAAYYAAIANLGLSQRFNDAYSRMLASWPTDAQYVYELPEVRPPSDEELLGVQLTAHMALLEQIRDTPAEAELGQPFRDAVDLARSGASYPVFMRCLIERGHDLLLERQVATRANIAAALSAAEVDGEPARAAHQRELLRAFDELVASSPWPAPDPFAFELRRARIDAAHEPTVAARAALVARWHAVLTLVVDWLEAHCAFAPTDPRFANDDPEVTQRNLDRARECHPGFVAVRERLLSETWGLEFDGIFQHETFAEEQRAGRVPYGDELIALAREARPYCVPGGSPPPDLVERAAALHAVAVA